MPARLAVYLPRQPVRQVILDPERPSLLGRGRHCDLRFEDPRLSRRHARFEPLGDEWYLTDLDSKNGTLLNGEPADGRRVQSGDWISLGGVIARFEIIPESTLSEERSRAIRRRETTREMRRSLEPHLGLNALLKRVLDSVLELSGLDRAFVLLSDDQGRMRLAATRGLSGQDLRESDFTGSWGAVRMSLDSGEAVVSGDVEAVTLLGQRPSVIQGGIRSLVCIPLNVADRVTGLVYADSKEPGGEFTELDLELLEVLCSQAAVAIGASRLGRELGELRDRLPVELPMDDRLSQLVRERLTEYRPVESDAELIHSALAGDDN